MNRLALCSVGSVLQAVQLAKVLTTVAQHARVTISWMKLTTHVSVPKDCMLRPCHQEIMCVASASTTVSSVPIAQIALSALKTSSGMNRTKSALLTVPMELTMQDLSARPAPNNVLIASALTSALVVLKGSTTSLAPVEKNVLKALSTSTANAWPATTNVINAKAALTVASLVTEVLSTSEENA